MTGVHGVLPEERERAQPFSLDIVAWVDMEAAQQSDDLADTVDYGALAQTAADVVGGRSVPAARGAGRAAGQRAADRGPPARGGRGHGAQAAPAAGPRRGLDRGAGAARPLMVPPAGVRPARRAAPWRAFIGLGSNLGDRRALLRRGVEGLRAGGDVVGVSPLYETEPVGGPEDQGPYLNVVVELSTADGPRRLLERCRALEEAAGRVRTVRWGPRTLDADVLLVDGWRGRRAGPGRPPPPPVGTAVRGAAPGRPGARSGHIGPAQGLWWGRRPCG